MFILLLIVLLLLITYLYVRWIRWAQYWKKRQVAYDPPHYLFGNMTFLMRENAALWLQRIYDQSKQPYFGIWIFWRPGLVVNSPEIAKNILIKDHGNFRNRFSTSGSTDPIGRLNLFSLKDPLWTVTRKHLSGFFTSSKLKGIQILITQKSKELVQRIEKDRQKPTPIDLRNIMADFTTDIIGTSSMGVVSEATLTGDSPIKNITAELMRFTILRALAWCCGFFIPELVDFFRFKIFPQESVDFARILVKKIIAQRGGIENIVTEPRDLLDILIKIRQGDSEDLDMSEDMMLAQVIIFLQAGFDTSSATLTFSIYELAFHPEVQEKLYKELQGAKDKYGDDLLDANVLSTLTWLNCVINESFRKYPIVGFLDRVSLADYVVDDHLTITAGTPVYVNIVGMHYDPDFYPDPKKFDPERFLPENRDSLQPFAFLPFGEGPRKCIGQRFGLSTVRHGLTSIILNYEVRPLPHSPKPIDIKWAKKGVLILPDEIMSVEFVPRNKS